jgi:hypothetical protein
MHNIRRTAVYAIRTYGGVGGGSCKASPYPDRTAPIQSIGNFLTPHFAGGGDDKWLVVLGAFSVRCSVK